MTSPRRKLLSAAAKADKAILAFRSAMQSIATIGHAGEGRVRDAASALIATRLANAVFVHEGSLQEVKADNHLPAAADLLDRLGIQ